MTMTELDNRGRALKAGRWLLATLALTAPLGCSGGAPGSRPDAINVSEAAGETFKCSPEVLKGDLTPFTVDWSDGERTALESAMGKGVAVVAMTCEGPKVLRACRVTGDYRYNGVSKKSKVVQMKDLMSVIANFGGALSNLSFSGEMKQGRSLNLAYVLVGNHATAVSDVNPALLIGRCDGATHFVFEAQLGAFAIETAEAGEAKASVQSIFGGGQASNASSKSSRTTDGDVAACDGAKRGDTEPVDGCAALMRVELMAIRGEPAGAATATSEADLGVRGAATRTVLGCPTGFEFVDGACVAAKVAEKSGAGQLCEYTNEADCQVQCKAGSTESCDRWGYLRLKAWDALRAPHQMFDDDVTTLTRQYDAIPAWSKDIKRWADALPAADMGLLNKACDEGFMAACGVGAVAGFSKVAEQAAPNARKDDAALAGIKAPLLSACAGGEVYSCMLVFHNLHQNLDDAERIAAFEGACASGNAELCGVVASLYADDVSHWGEPDDIGERSILTDVATANAKKYVDYMIRTCTGGVHDVCPLAAAQLIDDATVCAKMKWGGILRPVSFKHYVSEQVGDVNDAECSVNRNPFIAEDKTKALELLQVGCKGGHALSCEKIATFFPTAR